MNWKVLFDILNEMKSKLDNYEECWVYDDEQFDMMSDAIGFVRELAVKRYEEEVERYNGN